MFPAAQFCHGWWTNINRMSLSRSSRGFIKCFGNIFFLSLSLSTGLAWLNSIYQHCINFLTSFYMLLQMDVITSHMTNSRSCTFIVSIWQLCPIGHIAASVGLNIDNEHWIILCFALSIHAYFFLDNGYKDDIFCFLQGWNHVTTKPILVRNWLLY